MTAVQVLVGLLTLVVNAFFVGAEFAMISVRRDQVAGAAEDGDRRAVRVVWGLEHLAPLLAAAQLLAMGGGRWPVVGRAAAIAVVPAGARTTVRPPRAAPFPLPAPAAARSTAPAA